MKNKSFSSCVFALSLVATLTACGGDVKGQLGLRREGPDEFAVERKPKLEVPPSFKLRPPSPGEDPLNSTSPRDEARKALLGDGKEETPSETTAETPAASADDPLATLDTSLPPLPTTTDPMDDLKDSSEKISEKTELEVVDPTKTSSAAEGPKDSGLEVVAPDAAAGTAETKKPEPQPAAEKTEGENALLKKAGVDEKDDNIRSVLKKEYNEEQDQGVIGTLENISNNNFDKTIVEPAGEKERIESNKKENKPITEGETPAKSINHDKSFLEKIFN